MIQRQGQVLDEYGRPVPGSEIYVFNDDDTSADVTVDGTTPLTQPVTTDEFGAYSYYVEAAAIYREDTHYGGKLRYREIVPVGLDGIYPHSRAGQFFAFDANGAPVAASGTGADAALRSDLAQPTGAILVKTSSGVTVQAALEGVDSSVEIIGDSVAAIDSSIAAKLATAVSAVSSASLKASTALGLLETTPGGYFAVAATPNFTATVYQNNGRTTATAVSEISTAVGQRRPQYAIADLPDASTHDGMNVIVTDDVNGNKLATAVNGVWIASKTELPVKQYADTGTIYVSSVAANGIPVGDDTTGTGTAAAPYLTIDKGYTSASAGNVVLLNGLPSAPTDYRHATFLSVAKNITIDCVVPWGAKISSTTTSTRVINVAASGQTFILGRVIVDGRALTPACITHSAGASVCTTTLKRSRFMGFTQNGVSCATLTKVVFSADKCDFTTTAVGGTNLNCGIFLPDVEAGSSISITNCTGTLTDHVGSGFGMVRARANLVGIPCTVSDNVFTVAIKAALAGSGQHYGLRLQNMSAQVLRNTVTVTGGDGAHGGIAIAVSPDPLVAAYTITGTNVNDNTATVTSPGNIIIQIGQDTQGSIADAVISTGVSVLRNICKGSALGQGTGLHGILVGSPGITANVQRNVVSVVNLGLVDKCSAGTLWAANFTINCSGTHLRIKGAQGGTMRQNTCIETAAYAGDFVQPTNNDVPVITDTSSYTISANNFYAPSLTAIGFFTAGTPSQVVTYAGNNYYSPTGTTNPWKHLGTNYPTLGAWQAAVEATATSADPLFMNAAAGDYSIIAFSPLAGRVDRSASVLLDNSGRNYADPAAGGAFAAVI